jgi:NADPH:quinone reductase-like Zn-dependent oxidoreductase
MLIFRSFLSIGGKRMLILAAKPNKKDLEFIIKLVEDGRIKPVIDRKYSLHETSDAIKYLKQGHAQGKVVISVHQQ